LLCERAPVLARARESLALKKRNSAGGRQLITKPPFCVGEKSSAEDLRAAARRGYAPQDFTSINTSTQGRTVLMTFAEQRRYERVSVNISVHWGWTEDCPFRDRIINLGVGGCFVRTDQSSPPGRPVFIKFWLPDEAAHLAALVEHYGAADTQKR
jgi:hypothetical protein